MKNVTYINAGAGSGKTYTLTNILAARLCGKFYAKENQNGSPITVNPSEVILTTFTELAAAEFREKARQEILKSNNLEAAAQIDSAAIGTVHSVALKFIKKFWYLLDYGADIQTISERDEDFYLSQSLARLVEEAKYAQHFENFRRFRDHYDICDGSSHPDYLFWQKILNDIVEKMEYYDVNDAKESINRSIQTLRAVYNGPTVDKNVLTPIQDYLQKYCEFCKTKTTDGAKKSVEAIKPFLNGQKNLADIISIKKNVFSSPVGGKTRIEQNCPGYADFMTIIGPIPISRDKLSILEPFVDSIFTLAQVWREDYADYKKKKHIVSYNDMERLFLKLLDEKEVQDYVKEHYKLVMVDEFQDSNPIQLKIFNRLSDIIAESGGHSYWVGDPKQAIYGFRGADTDLVNAVAKQFTFFNDDQIHAETGPQSLGSGRLVESWRSRKRLVELVNDAFTAPFTTAGIDPLLITLQPHFTTDNLTSNALVHWDIQGNKSERADMIAYKVQEMLNSGMLVHHGQQDQNPEPITYKDIAILCRQNAECKQIVKALRKYGVPVAEPEDAIMQRAEVQLVVTLLQFIQNPTSKYAIACLKRLLLGESTEKILRDRIDYVQALNGNPDEWMNGNTTIQNLRTAAERYKDLSITDMVRAVIYENDIPALCAKWGDKETRYQNLSALQHLAEEYDQMCLQMGLGSSVGGFIYFLNTVEPDKEKDNLSDTVKVFTYHGAKGLEWPVVIMNELEKNSLDDDDFIKMQFMKVREVVLKDNSSKNNPFDKDYYLHYFPYMLKTSNNNPDDQLKDKLKTLTLYQEILERVLGEECRLLYVGMTRAKDYLCTIGTLSDHGEKREKNWLTNAGISGITEDKIWSVDENLTLLKNNIPVPSSPTPQYEIAQKPGTHTERGDRYLSPSKIEDFSGYDSHRAWSEHGTEISHNGWGNDYDRIGSCIHDIFAVYRPNEAQNKTRAERIIGGYGLAGELMGHVDAILHAAQWLYETLKKKYPQYLHVEKELPFMMTLPSGQTLRGEMDLICADEEGKNCVLIDYKSYQGVDLNKHTPQHYAQLSAYAAALKEKGMNVTAALIYYPVSGVVHELLRK